MREEKMTYALEMDVNFTLSKTVWRECLRERANMSFHLERLSENQSTSTLSYRSES